MGMNRITIVAGHAGAGKTNVAVSLALLYAGDDVGCTLIDFDTVNPYFRAADSADKLRAAGVRVIVPEFANTNVDIPTLPADIASVFVSDKGSAAGEGFAFGEGSAVGEGFAFGETAIFDVGGDDGAAALGVYRADIERVGYEMLYVVNMYRPLTSNPYSAASLMREIESFSRLKFTGIVNNSNLGRETTAETVAASVPFARELSELTGLPVVFTAVFDEQFAPPDAGRVFVMENHTKALF